MNTWRAESEPPPAQLGPGGWIRVVLRGTAVGGLILGGLAMLLPLRLVERPLFGRRRPWSPWIVQGFSASVFRVLGMRHEVEGRPMATPGAVVSNHSSWLDILALNARKRVFFVAKSEVAGWPGIGWLAWVAGTLFINRDPREAKAQQALLVERLAAGQKLLFFPEGTSTDGRQVLRFKSTLFQPFFTDFEGRDMHVQPVTLRYLAPRGAEPRFYAWWGDMALAPHLGKVLAARPQGAVRVIYHPALRVADFPDRKALAAACEAAVRSGLEHDMQGDMEGGGPGDTGTPLQDPVNEG